MLEIGDKVLVELEITSVDDNDPTYPYTVSSNCSPRNYLWVGPLEIKRVIDSVTRAPEAMEIPWQPVPADRQYPEDGDYLVCFKRDGAFDVCYTNRAKNGEVMSGSITHIAKVNFNRPVQQVTTTITCSPETLEKIKALGVEIK